MAKQIATYDPDKLKILVGGLELTDFGKNTCAKVRSHPGCTVTVSLRLTDYMGADEVVAHDHGDRPHRHLVEADGSLGPAIR